MIDDRHEPQWIDAVLEDVAQHLGEAVQPARGGRADDDGRAGPRSTVREIALWSSTSKAAAFVVTVDVGIDVPDHDRVGREQ